MMLEEIENMKRAVLSSIGRIDVSHLGDEVAAGARNYAVVRCVCNSVDPYREFVRLK